jgi:hypothetical protein
LHRFGRLKYWLEFHIFLCTLGPVMILFHTAFKFGGIVSISFWSMVLVVASGVIGRFIYIQIPRTIEGRELSLYEVKAMKGNLDDILKNAPQLDLASQQTILAAATVQTQHLQGGFFSRMVNKYFEDKKTIQRVKSVLRQNNFSGPDVQYIVHLVRNEIALNNRIDRLQVMQKMFRYWHIIHLPFALIMLIIMIIHVAVTVTFGFRWIF